MYFGMGLFLRWTNIHLEVRALSRVYSSLVGHEAVSNHLLTIHIKAPKNHWEERRNGMVGKSYTSIET